MTTLEKINEKLEALNAKRAELLKEIQKDFPDILKPIFEGSDKIQSFGWSQYTPYFNDGDECVFSSNVDYPFVNDEYVEDVDFLNKGVHEKITEENVEEHKRFNSTEYGYKWYADRPIGETGYFKNPNFDEQAYKTVEEFKNALSGIPDDFLRDLFGDHCKVTVNRNGSINIEEYYHN